MSDSAGKLERESTPLPSAKPSGLAEARREGWKEGRGGGQTGLGALGRGFLKAEKASTFEFANENPPAQLFGKSVTNELQA